MKINKLTVAIGFLLSASIPSLGFAQTQFDCKVTTCKAIEGESNAGLAKWTCSENSITKVSLQILSEDSKGTEVAKFIASYDGPSAGSITENVTGYKNTFWDQTGDLKISISEDGKFARVIENLNNNSIDLLQLELTCD